METLIQICAVFSPIILAGMGLYVSIRPPQKSGWIHWAWFAAFFILGLIGGITNFVELHNSSVLQESLGVQQQRLIQQQSELGSNQQSLINAQNSFNTLLNGTNIKLQEQTFAIDKLAVTMPHKRMLSASEIKKLVTFLKPFAHIASTITISCISGDSEGCSYAEQWRDLLEQSGWSINKATVEGIFYRVGGIFSGVVIQAKSPQTQGGGQLQHAFSMVGINARGELSSGLDNNNISLTIGSNQ